MRFPIIMSLLFFCAFCSGQDTLYQSNASMFSKSFILFEDGSFSYKYSHCTGHYYGCGSYQKTGKRISFFFEPCPEKKDSVICLERSKEDDFKLQLIMEDDSNLLETAIVSYDNQKFYFNDPVISLPKLLNDTLKISNFLNRSFNFVITDSTCSFYLISLDSSFRYGQPYTPEKKIVLKKNKDGTYQTDFQVIDRIENPEKPWKGIKNKRRITDIYEFRTIPKPIQLDK